MPLFHSWYDYGSLSVCFDAYKRYEALNEIIKNIRNSKKINDFNKMETLFMDLQKAFDKARPVVAKEENGVTPRLVLIVMQIIASIFCICT